MDAQFVVFRIGNEEYALEISQVKEIINYTKPTRIPFAIQNILGVINLRDKLLPVIDLRKKLNIYSEEKISYNKIIVIDKAARTFGVVVDEVTEVINIKKEDIEKTDEDISQGNNCIIGIAKQNKRIMAVIDLKLLMEGEI